MNFWLFTLRRFIYKVKMTPVVPYFTRHFDVEWLGALASTSVGSSGVPSRRANVCNEVWYHKQKKTETKHVRRRHTAFFVDVYARRLHAPLHHNPRGRFVIPRCRRKGSVQTRRLGRDATQYTFGCRLPTFDKFFLLGTVSLPSLLWGERVAALGTACRRRSAGHRSSNPHDKRDMKRIGQPAASIPERLALVSQHLLIVSMLVIRKIPFRVKYIFIAGGEVC